MWGGGVNMREAHIYIQKLNNCTKYTELWGGGGCRLSIILWGIYPPRGVYKYYGREPC